MDVLNREAPLSYFDLITTHVISYSIRNNNIIT